MKNVKFSFIIPVYNVEDYLDRCMESVLGQTWKNIEIILVDDGSQDRCGEMCDGYAECSPLVKVIHKVNGGLSSARNAGIDHAKGDYIFFLDSDDYVEKGMCQRLAAVVEQYPEADVISIDGWEETLQSLKSMRRISLQQEACKSGEKFLIDRYRQRNMNVEACLYIFSRDFLERINGRFEEGILHEDVEFTPRVLEMAQKVVEIPDAFYHYVIRENSISTKKNKEKNIRDLFQTLEQMDSRAEQMGNPELCKWTKDAVLNSYLNMIQEAHMYRKEYRGLVKKSFLKNKAATKYNFLRAGLCRLSIRLYCIANDFYKKVG